MVTQLGGFLAISMLVIATPGPDTALVVRNTLRGGRPAGVATSLGVTAGLAVWTLAASAGVAALLRASEPAFVTLKIAGSAFLIYLGVRSLWEAFRVSGAGSIRLPRSGAQTPRISLRQGLVSNLGNPKIAVFFTSFLPQFVPAHHAAFGSLLALGLVFCALTLGWLATYAVLVARAGDVFRRSRLRRALDGLTGVVLIGLGVRLALERRS